MFSSETNKSQGGAEPTIPPASGGRGSSGRESTLPSLSQPLNALVLLNALKRRWLAAAVLGVLAAGLVGAVVWFFLPPAPYAASVKFRVESKPQGTLYEHPEAKAEFSNYTQMQIAFLKSQLVLTEALKDAKVSQIPKVKTAIDPVDWLANQIHIDFPNGPEILRLTTSSEDRETCKTLADAISSAYLEQVKATAETLRRDRRLKMEEVKNRSQSKVKLLREEIRKKAEPVGSENPEVLALKQRIAHEQAMATQHELVELESRLRNLKNEQSLLPQETNPNSVMISQQEVEALVDKRLEITMLPAEKTQLEALIESEAKTATGGLNHPAVQKLVAKLESVKNELAARRKALQADTESQIRTAAAAAAVVRSTHLRGDIEKAEKMQKQLSLDVARLDGESRDINRTALDLEDQKVQIAQAEAEATRSIQEVEKMSVEEGDASRVSRWEDTIVTRPDEVERKTKIAGLSAAGAFGAIVLLVAFLEFRSRRVHSTHQVVGNLGMNLVGTVPAHTSRRAGGTPVWQNLLTESIDAARTLILHGTQSQSIRVVMITSAVGGEGKTSLAGHLAVSLARSGRKTLLVDGDLRNPAIHSLFDAPLGPGFSELLRGEVQSAEVIRPTLIPGLQILPAGNCDAATLSLLSQSKVGSVLADMKESFDVIVLDSSPVLPVADTLQLARHVDGVLLSVLLNVSTLPAIRETHQRLVSLNVFMLGAVVSGVHVSLSSYGRHRYLALAPAQVS